MKMQTPDNNELIEVISVAPYEDGLLVEGQIMGAMPMKAVLRPAQLRAGFRFLSFKLVWTLVKMLFRRSKT